MSSPTSSDVSVAVCIPVLDEVEGVAVTCRSVLASGHPPEQLALIVVVDGGRPEVVEAARAAGAQVFTTSAPAGSYAARNEAIAHLPQGVDEVLFTDAGCVIQPGWVDAHRAALRSAGLSGGAVVFTHGGGSPTPAGWVDSLRHLRQEAYVKQGGFAATCNLAVRREVLSALQFDPRLPSGGDVEFCRRARAAGWELVYTPDAVVHHGARAQRGELLAKVRRICGGMELQPVQPEMASWTKPRLNRRAYRTARSAGLRVGWWWGLRACVLDYRCARIVSQTVRRMLAADGRRDGARTPPGGMT